MKDWEVAKRQADLAIEEDPKNHVPWEWKADILGKVGDADGMVEARLTVFDLQPDNSDALRGKYELLVSLDRHAAVDEFVSETVRESGRVNWLISESQTEIRRLAQNPSLYPLTQIAFLKKNS